MRPGTSLSLCPANIRCRIGLAEWINCRWRHCCHIHILDRIGYGRVAFWNSLPVEFAGRVESALSHCIIIIVGEAHPRPSTSRLSLVPRRSFTHLHNPHLALNPQSLQPPPRLQLSGPIQSTFTSNPSTRPSPRRDPSSPSTSPLRPLPSPPSPLVRRRTYPRYLY